MFHIITIVAIAVVAAGIAVWHFCAKGAAAAAAPPEARRFPRLDALAGLVLALTFVLLVLTGFLRDLVGIRLADWLLLIHVGTGAAFAVVLAALVVFRADACRLGPSAGPQRFSDAQKVCFWLIAFSGLCLILTVAVAMLPVLGTWWQDFIVDVHRYVALAALLVGMVYAYLAFVRRGAKV